MVNIRMRLKKALILKTHLRSAENDLCLRQERMDLGRKLHHFIHVPDINGKAVNICRLTHKAFQNGKSCILQTFFNDDRLNAKIRKVRADGAHREIRMRIRAVECKKHCFQNVIPPMLFRVWVLPLQESLP